MINISYKCERCGKTIIKYGEQFIDVYKVRCRNCFADCLVNGTWEDGRQEIPCGKGGIMINWEEPLEVKVWGSESKEFNHDWEKHELTIGDMGTKWVDGWEVNEDGKIFGCLKSQIGLVRNKNATMTLDEFKETMDKDIWESLGVPPEYLNPDREPTSFFERFGIPLRKYVEDFENILGVMLVLAVVKEGHLDRLAKTFNIVREQKEDDTTLRERLCKEIVLQHKEKQNE